MKKNRLSMRLISTPEWVQRPATYLWSDEADEAVTAFEPHMPVILKKLHKPIEKFVNDPLQMSDDERSGYPIQSWLTGEYFVGDRRYDRYEDDEGVLYSVSIDFVCLGRHPNVPDIPFEYLAIGADVELWESTGKLDIDADLLGMSNPLRVLWDDKGIVSTTQVGEIGTNEIIDLLRSPQLRFVVYDPGRPLQWVPANNKDQFWASEVEIRLVEPGRAKEGFRLEEFPGEYCYTASMWRTEDGDPVILLMMHH